MRRSVAPVLLAVAAAIGFVVGRWSTPMAAGEAGAATRYTGASLVASIAPAEAVRAALGPELIGTTPIFDAHRPRATPAPAPGATLDQRYDALAARAGAGEAGAALELLQALDNCAQARETRAVIDILARNAAPDTGCASDAACARLEPVFDELGAALTRLRETEPACRDLGRERLDARGDWLARAAELGDTEAMACFALAGGELAPHPSDERFGPWMERWRRTALPLAWDAWRRGDPRAAVALARIYGPDEYWRGGADELAPADVRLEYRFALLLTRALELDPAGSDLARTAYAAAESLNPDELARAGAVVDADLGRIRATRIPRHRTPDACWQHFAMFPAPGS